MLSIIRRMLSTQICRQRNEMQHYGMSGLLLAIVFAQYCHCTDSQVIFSEVSSEDIWGSYDATVLEPAVTDRSGNLHYSLHSSFPK